MTRTRRWNTIAVKDSKVYAAQAVHALELEAIALLQNAAMEFPLFSSGSMSRHELVWSEICRHDRSAVE
jgi:hypothetical protein